MLSRHWLIVMVLFIAMPMAASAQTSNTSGESGSGSEGSTGTAYKGPGMSQILSEICTACMFPIRIAGVTDGDSRNVPSSAYDESLCWCKRIMGIPIPGIPYGGWVPERMIETVRGAYDSPIFGRRFFGGSGASSLATRFKLQGGSAAGSQIGFFNVHVFKYPAGEIYGDMLASACWSNTSGGSTMAYMSEIDPTWPDDSVSLILTPEAGLFATMPAQLACMADAAAADVYQPIDAMFWCMGSWGSAYPQDGATPAMDVPRQAAYAAAKALAMLTRRFMINKTMGNDAICNAYPEPILIKSMFKMEQLWPVPELDGDHWIGEDPNLWGEYRYRAYTGEDFVQLIWQWVDCCMY